MMYPWQDSTTAAFRSYTDSGRVPQGLLIWGPSGCGKFDLAHLMARELLCLDDGPGACGECRSCKLLDGGAHPDFREITFEINKDTGKLRDVIRVDQIRALIEALYKTTTISNRKVAIIHPAERMHVSASNALLKTLEEPVGDTVQILVAHDPGRLPATVLSRCQKLHLGLPDPEQAHEWLVTKAGTNSEDAKLALKASAGSPLEALSLIEEGSLESYRDTVRMLVQLRNGSLSAGRATAAMADYDPARLWSWLSLKCVDLLRATLPHTQPGKNLQSLTELQKLADRNRLLVATPVRKDLLLRDWLIQWATVSATMPLGGQSQEA